MDQPPTESTNATHAAGPAPVLTRLLPGLVLAVALVAAACSYYHFLAVARQLFAGVGEHDRHAHYWLGLTMGLDLRQGALGHLLYDIHKARTWPPLHALLV